MRWRPIAGFVRYQNLDAIRCCAAAVAEGDRRRSTVACAQCLAAGGSVPRSGRAGAYRAGQRPPRDSRPAFENGAFAPADALRLGAKRGPPHGFTILVKFVHHDCALALTLSGDTI
jgi:hypothetical protein